jgi:hypothetical protein
VEKSVIGVYGEEQAAMSNTVLGYVFQYWVIQDMSAKSIEYKSSGGALDLEAGRFCCR